VCVWSGSVVLCSSSAQHPCSCANLDVPLHATSFPTQTHNAHAHTRACTHTHTHLPSITRIYQEILSFTHTHKNNFNTLTFIKGFWSSGNINLHDSATFRIAPGGYLNTTSNSTSEIRFVCLFCLFVFVLFVCLCVCIFVLVSCCFCFVCRLFGLHGLDVCWSGATQHAHPHGATVHPHPHAPCTRTHTKIRAHKPLKHTARTHPHPPTPTVNTTHTHTHIHTYTHTHTHTHAHSTGHCPTRLVLPAHLFWTSVLYLQANLHL